MLSEPTLSLLTPETDSDPGAKTYSRIANWLDAYRVDISEGIDPHDGSMHLLADRVERIALSAGDAGLLGLQDVCLFLTQYLMDLGSAGDDACTDERLELLRQWPDLVAAYLLDTDQIENGKALIKHLENPSWPDPIGPEDRQVLVELIGGSEATHSSTAIAVNTEAEDSFDVGLQSLAQRMKDLRGLDESRNSAVLEQIIDGFDKLSQPCEEHELLGLQDVCMLMQQQLIDLRDKGQGVTLEQQAWLVRWPELVQAYLADPARCEASRPLIACLSESCWPSPLPADDADVLLEMLCPGDEMVAPELDSGESIPNWPDPVVPEQVTEISEDLIDMLGEELPRLQERLAAVIQQFGAEQCAQLGRQLERFGNAAQAAGANALYVMALFVSANIERLTATALPVIDRWLEAVNGYLTNLGESAACEHLISCLRDEAWHYPWPEEKSAKLRAALQALQLVSAPSTHVEALPVAADISAEDLSLAVPEDISQELLDGLLHELPQQTERLSQAIQNSRNLQDGAQAVHEAQRVAHTIKGAANTVGVKGLANLTHRLEDILIILRDHALRPSASLHECMVEAADCLEEMSEALVGLGEAPAQAPAVLQSVVQWVHRFTEQGAAALQADYDAADEQCDQITTPPADIDSTPVAEAQAVTEAAEPILRVPASMVDDLLRIVGESLILGSQLQERVQRTAASNRALIQRSDYLQNLVAELDQLVQIRGIDLQREQLAVDAGFDPLELDRYNELHTITHRLVEAASDALELGKGMARQLGELDELLVGQERLSNDTQYIGMRSRMLPIKTILPRLQRSVRQTCRSTGKAAELHLSGDDALLDSDVLSALIDPLMHLLRNAVDHGIETSEERSRSGKALHGRIELHCIREGNQVVIRCSDDGAGLNMEQIRETARRRGVASGAGAVSDEMLQRLIFEPGFSTRRATSQISGRGVGLDIVYSAVQGVKGSMHVENRPGDGCTFELRVPVSLMSLHGLIVRVRGQTVAIATHGIEQILHPQSGRFSSTEQGDVFEFEHKHLAAQGLEELLGFGPDRRKQSRTTRPVLLVRQDNRQCAVTVEQIQQTRNLVVKELGKYLPAVKGVIGATIFGDGSVVPVIDLPELLRNPVSDLEHSKRMMRTDFIEDLPLALVVDDSISARRSLEQVMTDIGMRVRTAKDGLEALESIEQQRPQLLLVDLEMPRMNGLELAAHVRATRELSDLPIIMITSRSASKHRQLAEAAGVDIYLTKPYSEDALFDHVDTLLRRGSEAAE